MKIGCISDSFRLGFEDGIRAAAKVGVTGVQKYMTYGDFTAANMTPERVREVRSFMESQNLIFSAICGDFGKNLDEDDIVDLSKRVLDKAKELGCGIVTTHIGHIDMSESSARMEKTKENAYKLAAYADSIGSVFACETGTEKAEQLRMFLDQLGAKGLRVNLDPANLVMVAHDDPVQAVYTLKDYIVHTHAKDGIVTTENAHGWLEVPLGKGGVDWDNYLRALQDIGFDGYLTIEREVGEQPAADIGMAVGFLKEKLNALSIPLN